MRPPLLIVASIIIIFPNAVSAKDRDKTIRWYYNTPQGGKTFAILQCQSLTFDWNRYGDGNSHSVWEFDDEEAYISCDRSKAQPIQTSLNSGLVAISGTDTLNVTKRFFGSLDNNDCEEGKMKAALKIRPLLRQYKFEGRGCQGGTVDIVKKEDSVKECRNRCKRRRACVAIQYANITSSNECKVFSQIPSAVSKPTFGVSCEIAITSCDPTEQQEELSLLLDDESTNDDTAAAAANKTTIIGYDVDDYSPIYDISGEGDSDLKLSVSQITFGPKHHLFGYIGQSLTIPWSGNDRYIVALESGFHDHLPLANETARIVLIDTLNDVYSLEVLDETHAWNLQQGTMLFWNPHALDTQFFFNDRDVATNKIFTVLYDIDLRKRIREYRFHDNDGTPVANGGVCPNGEFFYAINYARMARLRPVTGYPDAWDWTVGDRAPANDGIWKVDIESGAKELLASFQNISNLLDEDENIPASLYINHALSSRECTRIYFFGRGSFQGKEQAINQAFTMKSDGSELKRVRYVGGHPEWYNESIVIGKISRNIIMYDVELEKKASVLGEFDDPNGDLSLSANGKMFVNGWEDSESLRYHFVRLTDGAGRKSLPLDRGPYNRGALRIDAAPRWNRAGNKVLVPGWVDGARQLHVITVEGAAID